MEQTAQKPLKLNIKRTMLIGFAFFGILLLWQVYDSWCPTFLQELFMSHIPGSSDTEVQYLVGIMMAIDNLAALILLPIFGRISDKTHSRIGKRMPYILVGTFVCAVTFPFIPVLCHQNNIVGVVVMMFIIAIFAMMYRNPAVALMPDITPKPLRSKANGLINIMGYIGGACATFVGMAFILTDYLGTSKKIKFPWQTGNIWAIEAPFLIASVLMLISAVVLFITIKENKIAEEVKDDMARGELEAEVVDKVEEDKPMTKANRNMLFLILGAEFFWFMADNGIQTFLVNYTINFLGAGSDSAMLNTILGGVGSVAGFAIGGFIASKISRKWTVVGGLALTLLGYLLWTTLTFSIPGLKGSGSFPTWLYAVWFLKGFGMSLVHVNSFPMVVELCPNNKIGQFTGYYYASSMAAQTITPIALGALLFAPSFGWEFVPLYGLVCVIISLALFLVIKNVKNKKTKFASALEGLGTDD